MCASNRWATCIADQSCFMTTVRPRRPVQTRVDSPRTPRRGVRHSIFAALLVLATALITVACLFLPIVGVGLVGLVLFLLAAQRVGLQGALVVFALVGLTAAGFLARSSPGTQSLTQICTLLLIGVGILNLPHVRVPPGILVAAAVFVAVSTVSSSIVLGTSLDYGLRSWIALNSPIFIACAVAGVLRPGAAYPSESQQRRIRWLRLTVLGAVVANVLVGGRQALFGLTGAEAASAADAGSTYEVDGVIRLMGTFTTNQDFGVFAACAAPAVLVYALKSSGKQRLWLGLLTALFYFVVLLSLTRTALIASVVVGVAAFLRWGGGSVARRVVITVMVVIGGVCAVGLLSLVAIPRVQASLARATTLFALEGDGSFLSRGGRTLPRALAILEQNPFGVGSGSAGPVSGQFPSLAPYGQVTTDNGYLMIGIQLGFIGALAFIAMLLLIAVHLGRSGSAYANAGAAAVASLMIAMLLAGYWSLIAPMALTAAIVGLGLGDRARQTDLTRSTHAGKRSLLTG